MDYIPTPMIINTSDENDDCPKCHKEEDKQEVCKHCGYVYSEDEGSGWDILWVFLLFLFILWFLFTIIIWAIDMASSYGEKVTLLKFFANQFSFLGKLFKNIW